MCPESGLKSAQCALNDLIRGSHKNLQSALIGRLIRLIQGTLDFHSGLIQGSSLLNQLDQGGGAAPKLPGRSSLKVLDRWPVLHAPLKKFVISPATPEPVLRRRRAENVRQVVRFEVRAVSPWSHTGRAASRPGKVGGKSAALKTDHLSNVFCTSRSQTKVCDLNEITNFSSRSRGRKVLDRLSFLEVACEIENLAEAPLQNAPNLLDRWSILFPRNPARPKAL